MLNVMMKISYTLNMGPAPVHSCNHNGSGLKSHGVSSESLYFIITYCNLIKLSKYINNYVVNIV